MKMRTLFLNPWSNANLLVPAQADDHNPENESLATNMRSIRHTIAPK